MAEIKPLRAWRYNADLIKDIDKLVSPLFDVVSESQREALYEEELNSIHLSVPRGEDSADGAAERLKQWKSDGIIQQDDLPAIYVYYQYFTLPGSDKERIRKGFIANLRVYDWHEKVLLRHENTMPFSVNDRMEILDKTQLNVSPTHGLYTDPTHEIERYLDEAMLDPLYETEDYQGVRDVFSVIHDAKIIKRIMEIIEDKQIILADGHHRYEGSLLYQKAQAKNPEHTGKEGYNYHLMYFTNTESDDLRILPTHRVIQGIEGFSKEDLLQKIDKYFFIKPIEEATDVNEVILGKQWAFGLLIGDEAYKIRLKPELIDTIEWEFPRTIKELDLTVMHYFIFEKCLGIKGKDQRGSKNLTFERNFTKCLTSVTKRESQCAIITKDISIETVKEVCYSGYTLPQKSTYFYPKVICGFLFGSIEENEFNSFFDEAFQ
ncbi:Uncharacterized conserved protein, DUF1015 family [Ekhidna lutea]|uniref:Uncharacterized conserved protein, DUF1015 family n=1 Tax=Ekhidna lutea TaxID=447679 RepID=A0A239GJI0_EKHLU|nr:DUF1015 domain-containing protein [Ekhidna lutea]SNS69327.1 Uncharacterized conserved protein, DUF1015 family [Ekhidna lutea]